MPAIALASSSADALAAAVTLSVPRVGEARCCAACSRMRPGIASADRSRRRRRAVAAGERIGVRGDGNGSVVDYRRGRVARRSRLIWRAVAMTVCQMPVLIYAFAVAEPAAAFALALAPIMMVPLLVRLAAAVPDVPNASHPGRCLAADRAVARADVPDAFATAPTVIAPSLVRLATHCRTIRPVTLCHDRRRD